LGSLIHQGTTLTAVKAMRFVTAAHLQTAA